jgi:hypothetical protein
MLLLAQSSGNFKWPGKNDRYAPFALEKVPVLQAVQVEAPAAREEIRRKVNTEQICCLVH